jgi:hypothetical protein
MEQWLYELDALFEDGSRKNAITNEKLLAWLDKYLDPKEWFIEITGGEPGLYPEIKALIIALGKKGYKGLIRTNGSKPLPYSSSFKRITAWHKQAVEIPKYYDFILILENPDDDWQAKRTYCEENNIPHAVFPYKFFSIGDGSQTRTSLPKVNSLFREMTTMFSSGAIGGCFTSAADSINGAALHKMSEPIVREVCGMCGNIEGVEYFINNVPGFRELLGLTEADVLPHKSFMVYPALNIRNEWVDKDGKVVGVLGDDISAIPQEKVFA